VARWAFFASAAGSMLFPFGQNEGVGGEIESDTRFPAEADRSRKNSAQRLARMPSMTVGEIGMGTKAAALRAVSAMACTAISRNVTCYIADADQEVGEPFPDLR
jgi:hypothetical protein